MLNKMVKLKNKKAFTLIEMMAVVAIVAILVAILVPVIGNSTVKSRAATNAANLRAVEAELATLKVSNPECFVAATKTSGTDLWSMFKNGYIWFYDLVNGENSSSLNFDTVTASAGVLTFHTDNFTHSGESIDLAGVPTSVAVKADTGMDVPEGGEMVILLIDNEIRALYKGENNKYFDKDDFAEVAETGKFTGEGTSSGKDFFDKFEEVLCDKLGSHDWEYAGNETHKCQREGCTATGTCSDQYSIYDKVTGIGVGSPNGECDYCGHNCMHKYENGVCKYGCGTVCPTCNGEGETDGCSECGLTHKHIWRATGVSGRYRCSVCEKTCGNTSVSDYQHNFTYVDATTHKCKTCDYTTNHSGVKTCSECGATRENRQSPWTAPTN